jgi:hypothetical protein
MKQARALTAISFFENASLSAVEVLENCPSCHHLDVNPSDQLPITNTPDYAMNRLSHSHLARFLCPFCAVLTGFEGVH